MLPTMPVPSDSQKEMKQNVCDTRLFYSGRCFVDKLMMASYQTSRNNKNAKTNYLYDFQSIEERQHGYSEGCSTI